MPPIVGFIFIVVFALLFTAFGVMLVVAPSVYFETLMRNVFNPAWYKAPWNRIQMRSVGVVFALSGLMFLAAGLGGALKSEAIGAFARSFHIVLLVVFFTVLGLGLVSRILWFVPQVRSFIATRYAQRAAGDPEWHRRETVVFFFVLLVLVGVVATVATLLPPPE